MLWSVVQVVLIPIIIGFIFQKIAHQFAHKAATALPLVSVIAISLILAAVVAGSKAQILKTGLLFCSCHITQCVRIYNWLSIS